MYNNIIYNTSNICIIFCHVFPWLVCFRRAVIRLHTEQSGALPRRSVAMATPSTDQGRSALRADVSTAHVVPVTDTAPLPYRGKVCHGNAFMRYRIEDR